MAQEIIRAEGLQLTYLEQNAGEKNTIFFVHGNSCSSNNWRKQVDDRSLDRFRLIAIDLPNHGEADAIDANGDFSLPGIAKIMRAAIAQLHNNQPFIICAVSLGTNIAVEMLSATLNAKGLLLAGPCISGKGFELDKIILPGADVSAVFTENMPELAVIKYAKETSISNDPVDLELFLSDYYAVKGNFRSALYATIASGNYNDEIEMLQRANLPVCIIFGSDEKVVNTHYLDGAPFNIWNNSIYKIPGASHLVNIDKPDAFNELLVVFANDIFTTGAV